MDKKKEEQINAMAKGFIKAHLGVLIEWAILIFVFMYVFDKYGYERMLATCFATVIISMGIRAKMVVGALEGKKAGLS